MKTYLHLIEIFIKELPKDSFHNSKGEEAPNLYYVTFKEGAQVNLTQLREGCLEQLPDEFDAPVKEWIEHQKEQGGAEEDTIIFYGIQGDNVLHITFIEEE